jgi:general secretion pathway protein D
MKNVATALPGVTAAVINSKYVPLIITAIQHNGDSRIVATPQLLLDDNEDGSVSSEQVITSTVLQTTGNNSEPITGAGDQVRAGTSLSVNPQISENAVKLTLGITQSSFTGTAGTSGIPPIIENNVDAVVTVPRDCSIVIGGLVVESNTNTVAKVPLLGDIPILGLLFSDHNKTKQKTTLYVFITPTIMKDPNFADLRLLTEGPAEASRLHTEFLLPPPEPMGSTIDAFPVKMPGPASNPSDVPASPPAPATTPAAPVAPENTAPLPDIGAPAPIGADIAKDKKKEKTGP